MYRKGKSHEINDIIYSADATADYSHTNKYYEEVYDNKKSFINDNTGNINTSIPTSTSTPTPTSTSTNTFTNNRFRQNNDNKLNSVNSDNTSTSKSNIFLKASSQSNLFASNNISAKNEPAISLSLDNDNFPSLGSTSKTNSVSNAAKTLDFKKIVQTKQTVVQNIATTPSVHKPSHSSNKLAMYQEIKDKSEKYAKVKMYNEYSSDDDAY